MPFLWLLIPLLWGAFKASVAHHEWGYDGPADRVWAGIGGFFWILFLEFVASIFISLNIPQISTPTHTVTVATQNLRALDTRDGIHGVISGSLIHISGRVDTDAVYDFLYYVGPTTFRHGKLTDNDDVKITEENRANGILTRYTIVDSFKDCRDDPEHSWGRHLVMWRDLHTCPNPTTTLAYEFRVPRGTVDDTYHVRP